MVTLAKRLHRASPKTGKHGSLREIATELAAQATLHITGTGVAARAEEVATGSSSLVLTLPAVGEIDGELSGFGASPVASLGDGACSAVSLCTVWIESTTTRAG